MPPRLVFWGELVLRGGWMQLSPISQDPKHIFLEMPGATGKGVRAKGKSRSTIINLSICGLAPSLFGTQEALMGGL